jgi:hypothetical protein
VQVLLVALFQRTHFFRRKVFSKSGEGLIKKRVNSVMIREIEKLTPANGAPRERLP